MSTAPGPRHRRRRGALVATLVVVVLGLAGVAAWAEVGSRHYYAFQPGTAPTITTAADCRAAPSGALVLPGGRPCARVVLPAGRSSPLHGRILMVDVLLGPSSALQYLAWQVGLLGSLSPGSQLVAASSVLGTTPRSQFQCQNTEEMVQATTTAPPVALRRLGYRVRAVDHGGRVFQVVLHTAAARAGIKCDDLVTAIDGTPTPTASAVAAAIHAHRPGQQVRITVQRRASAHSSRTLHLTATLTGVPALDGQPAHPNVAFLGVATTTATTYTLPFPVRLEVGNIGGPSDGLALTLGTIDALTGGRLTGGHTVAATGTIAPDGTVGDVSGVAQKTVAVQRAGATLFLVPLPELHVARRAARPGLRVEAVGSLSAALADLRAVGGHVPAPS